MKKITLSILMIFLSGILFAQNEVDALRYSQEYYGGSARYLALGGAFSALGGDLSSITLNPASTGIYTRSEFTFTPSFFYSNTSSNFNESKNYDYKYNVNINNIGVVLSSGKLSEDGGGISTFNFAFGYNRLNNFNNRLLISGVNNTSSYSDYFAQLANGKSTNNFNNFAEGLAWDGYLIDPIDSSGTSYKTSFDSYGETQRRSVSSKGGSGNYYAAMGLSYKKKLYIGASLNVDVVNYTESSIYDESDPDDKISDFNSFTYTQYLKTEGSGFNMKLGIIARPINWFRFGASIHSPTFYKLKDTYSSKLTTSFNDKTKSKNLSSGEGIYDYQLNTPFRANAGLAFIIKKSAIISIDYEYLDYSTARLRANDYPFYEENNTIETSYIATGNIKAGLEYRFGPISLRGGYAMYGSPYRSNLSNAGASLTSYSGGFGVRTNDMFFDLTYIYSQKSENYYLYNPEKISINPAKINYTANRIVATLGLIF